VSGPVKFTTTGEADRALIARAGVLYAAGSGVAIASGRWQLILTEVRPLRHGRYTLTLRSRKSRRSITQRVQVTMA
jgi:hypothetical protein